MEIKTVRDTCSWSSIIRKMEEGIKKITVSILMIIMFMYSAIKIRANAPLLYSVLNPDTSSDSPSAKSNGVRFVSANVVVNQHKNRRGNKRIGGDERW